MAQAEGDTLASAVAHAAVWKGCMSAHVSLRFRHYTVLALIGFMLFWPGQRELPPIDRDEPRYAQATEQMLATGNFIDVRFQDQPRYLQPAGIYWLQAVAESVAGTPGMREIWVHRLPSLLGAIAAVLLTASIGSRLFGPGAGAMSAVLLATSLLLGFESHLATIDATLLAVILVAQNALSAVYLGRDSAGPPNRRLTCLFWVAIGVGLMLKGPVILLVFGGTLAGLAIVERRMSWMMRLMPASGILLALAIVLPWFVAIGVMSGGDFFARSVGHNFLGKIAAGQQAHGLPPGYHVVLFPMMFWPGSLLAVLALPYVWANRRQPETRFLLCWIVPTWLTFELIATKLPHYVLPAYPAIACLTAAAAMAPGGWVFGRWQRRAFQAFCVIWLGIGLALSLGLPVLLWWLEGVLKPLSFVIGVVALCLIVAAFLGVTRRQPLRAVALATLAALLVFVNGYAVVLPGLTQIWISPRVAAAVAALRPCPDSVLASSSFSEPSLVFLVGTPTKLMYASASAEHLLANPRCGLALIDVRQSSEFLERMALAGEAPRRLAEIDGINYSNGRRLELTLYAGAESGSVSAGESTR
jgi:4-amino-4-deoxy-L-arabinose transferase-like glycosyltransferase